MRAGGWRWVEVAPDFPYGHTYGLRRLSGNEVPLTDVETTARDGLKAELDKLEAEYAQAEEFPAEVDQRLGEIETALAAFDERPLVYQGAEIARAGAFVSIDSAGAPRIERGYVRPEDEAPVAPPDEDEVADPEVALALREAIAGDPDTAFLAMLHALCLRLFYRLGPDTCLEVEAKSILFGTQVQGLGDMAYATAIDVPALPHPKCYRIS